MDISLKELYGYGVCDAFGDKHCVGRCYCPMDCGARPIPKEAWWKERLLENSKLDDHNTTSEYERGYIDCWNENTKST